LYKGFTRDLLRKKRTDVFFFVVVVVVAVAVAVVVVVFPRWFLSNFNLR